jgi:hypothetical protein
MSGGGRRRGEKETLGRRRRRRGRGREGKRFERDGRRRGVPIRRDRRLAGKLQYFKLYFFGEKDFYYF